MENFIKGISAFILSIVVAINAFGNFIGVGDLIPTDPATTLPPTTITTPSTEDSDAEAIADFIALYNSETAKIVANGSYDFKRVCNYTKPVDVGSATDVLNSIISSIDENSNLDSVVGGFLGIGITNGTYPDNVRYYYEDYLLKSGALKAEDIKSFSYNNGVYTFTLSDAANPKKTGETALSRFTNDFITEEEVAESIADFTTAITVEGSDGTINNIKVSVTVVDGKITNIKYSYNMDASLNLKATVLKTNATLATRTSAEYSNIEY